MKEEYKWVQNFPPAVPLVGIVLGLVFVMLKSPNIVASDTVSTGIGLGFGMSIAAAIAFAIAWSSRRLAQTEARVQFASRWAWAILIASFIAQFANSGLSDAVQPPQTKTASHGNSLESQLLAVANEVTRSAPQIIDADTRLDGAVAGPGLSITYLLSLPNVPSTDIAPTVFDTNMAPLLRKSACSNGELKEFFDNSVTVHYSYRGSDGGPIGTVTVSRTTCT